MAGVRAASAADLLLLLLLLLGGVLLLGGGGDGSGGGDGKAVVHAARGPEPLAWQLHERRVSPFNYSLEDYPAQLTASVWNDPSMLVESDGTLRMWLSVGNLTAGSSEPNYVWSHRATAVDDGTTTFVLDPTTAVLRPSAGKEWDNLRAATPAVVWFKGQYHMFYSGMNLTCSEGLTAQCTTLYETGHATSPDGILWTKDPGNPLLDPTSDCSTWGCSSAAELGPIVVNDTLLVFYVTSQTRLAGELPADTLESAILVISSKDGFTWTHHPQPVLRLPEEYYDLTAGYRGLSTPWAVQDACGMIHLFTDVWIANETAGNYFQQVALMRAVAPATNNGWLSFTAAEVDVVTTSSLPWASYEVRGPSVLFNATTGEFRMWYAGNTEPSAADVNFYRGGVGYATAPYPQGVCTPAPTLAPSTAPTLEPSNTITVNPVAAPSPQPTSGPLGSSTPSPTPAPSVDPTPAPSLVPTVHPSVAPTLSQAPSLSRAPTGSPTDAVSSVPSMSPTMSGGDNDRDDDDHGDDDDDDDDDELVAGFSPTEVGIAGVSLVLLFGCIGAAVVFRRHKQVSANPYSQQMNTITMTKGKRANSYV